MLTHLQRSTLVSYYSLWVKLARICTFPKDLVVIWSQITDYMLINSVLFFHLGLGTPLNKPLSYQGSHYSCTLLQQYNMFPLYRRFTIGSTSLTIMSRRLLIKVTEIIYSYCKVTLTTGPHMCPTNSACHPRCCSIVYIFSPVELSALDTICWAHQLLMIRISMIVSTLGQACMYVLLGTFPKPKDLILVGSHICLLTLNFFLVGLGMSTQQIMRLRS